MALRIDNHREVARTAGKDAAARCSPHWRSCLEPDRAETRLRAHAAATFMWWRPAFRRAMQKLANGCVRSSSSEAHLWHRRSRSSAVGVASLGRDEAATIEELMGSPCSGSIARRGQPRRRLRPGNRSAAPAEVEQALQTL